MNSKELHGPECNCSQCTLGIEEIVTDLTSLVAKEEVFALGEKVHRSCQKLFKPREEMLDRTNYCDSNDCDSDLIIYIPFSSQTHLRSMTIIGGEEDTSPYKIKIFVNKEESQIDFDLKEANCEQEITCTENPEGHLKYFLKANKFHSVWSLTLAVTQNYGGDKTRIYYIGFEGTNSHKRKTFKIELSEKNINQTPVEQKQEPNIPDHLIYG
jgi:hypothetical protein